MNSLIVLLLVAPYKSLWLYCHPRQQQCDSVTCDNHQSVSDRGWRKMKAGKSVSLIIVNSKNEKAYGWGL